MYNDLDEDLVYVEPIEMIAIIPPKFLLGTKFDITSSMIQLLNLKIVFDVVPTNYVYMHIMNFVGICTLYILFGISKKIT